MLLLVWCVVVTRVVPKIWVALARRADGEPDVEGATWSGPVVTAYVGEPSAALTARAWLWGLLSKYGWTLWAAIQDGTSELDFDFWAWGMEKYDRAVAEFDGPDLGRRLEEVRLPY